MVPAAADDRCRVSGLVSTAVTELATVISSPSRIQATPRATTIRVWKGDQGNRSIRAGMRLRMAPGASAGVDRLVIEHLQYGNRAAHYPVGKWLTRETTTSPVRWTPA